MTRGKLDELIAMVKELEEKDEDYFTQLIVTYVEAMTEGAALIRLHDSAYKAAKGKRREASIWFPIRAIKKFDGELYFYNRIAREKGLDVRR